MESKLVLRPADRENAKKEWEFITEMPADENGMTNEWHGITLRDFEQTALPAILDSPAGKNLHPGYVPDTSFFLWEDDEPVGLFRVRHYLNDSLRNGAGHIGYCIRREYRGRGYGTEGLRQTLVEAQRIVPETEFYLRVNKNNPASLRVMQKNGGTIVGEDDDHFFVHIPNPSGGLIRPASQSDTDGLLDLYKSMRGGPAGWNEFYPSEENIRQDLERNSLYVMTDPQGRLMAALTLDEDKEVDSLPCWNSSLRPFGEPARLCVRKDLQRKGIARKMMEYAMECLKTQGCRGIRMLVASENIAALKSYSVFEFETVGSCDLFGIHFLCLERALE